MLIKQTIKILFSANLVHFSFKMYAKISWQDIEIEEQSDKMTDFLCIWEDAL